jgi:hypothetical protein
LGEGASEILFMLGCEFKVIDEVLDTLEPCKYHIFSLERVLPKKYIKCGCLLVFFLLEIRI